MTCTRKSAMTRTLRQGDEAASAPAQRFGRSGREGATTPILWFGAHPSATRGRAVA